MECSELNSKVLASILHTKKQEKLFPAGFIDRISRAKKEPHIDSKQVRNIQVNGKVDSEMDLENKFGLMERSTLESGARTKHTARVSSSTLMVTFMTVSGQTIKPMAQVPTDMLTGRCTKENGRTIFNMVAELKLGPTRADMKVSTLMVESMVSVATSGQMEANTLETGAKTRLADLAFIPGWTVGDMKVNGTIIIWRDLVFMFGMMVECIKASTKMTKRMVSAFTHGLTAVAMKVTGIEANNTV